MLSLVKKIFVLEPTDQFPEFFRLLWSGKGNFNIQFGIATKTKRSMWIDDWNKPYVLHLKPKVTNPLKLNEN